MVESVPVTDKISADIGFSKKISYIRKDIFTLVRAEYLDSENKIIRKMEVSNLKEITDDLWFGTHMEMEDLEEASRTVLEYENIEYNTDINEDYFTIRHLTRTVP